MKKATPINALDLSKRVVELTKPELDQLLKALPTLENNKVTFPVRGLAKPTLYPSSWRRFPVKIAKTLSVGFDDLHFVVTDGGGKVSTAHDPDFDPANPHIMLLAGARAGTYKVVALAPGPNKTTQAVGQLEFVVSAQRTDQAGDGPSLWIDGQVKGIGTAKGQPTWGEPGDKGKTGQVYPEVTPAIGVKRVLALLVDTASDRYPATDIEAILTGWRDTLTNGVVENDLVTRSVRAFYEEMSYYLKGVNPPVGLTLETRVEGAISLPGSWEDHFPGEDEPITEPDPADPEPDEKKKKKIVTRRLYSSADHLQAVVDVVAKRNLTLAPKDQIDLTSFDVLCCVIRTVRPAAGTTDVPKSFWPRRQYLTLKIPAPTPADPAATQDKNMDPFNMPDDWPDFGGRTFQDTVCHEFGHSLGLGDLYTPGMPDVTVNNKTALRNMADWDTMAYEEQNPHFSLVSRLKLGWTKPDWLKRFNFLIKNDIDETITISAVEKGAPPAGSFVGAEIRIGMNWNYYVEYRARQTGQIGDNQLPADDRVVCTDAIAQGFQTTSSRPEVMLLWNDPSIASTGPVLGPGESYIEQDPNGNGKQLKISVLSIKNGLATVNIQYKVLGVDLGIRPWPASPDRPWQSPDIELRNEKSKTDPSFFNTAWTGQPNDIVARITNSGTANAPGVAVQFSIKDYNLGGDTPTVEQRPKVIMDVPAGATVEFISPQWIPTKNQGHYCVCVDILPYATKTLPVLVDMNPGNSSAQSNYITSTLESASPTERTMVNVKVGNPHNKPTIAYLIPSQTNPFYRTYLSNRWIRLKPKEVREVTVLLESQLDWDAEKQQFMPFMSAVEWRAMMLKWRSSDLTRLISQPNEIALAAYMPDPTTGHGHVIRLLGGAQLQARSGRKIQIVGFQAKGRQASGRVVTTDKPAQPVNQGQVILIYSNPADTKRAYLTLPVVDGSFRTPPNIQGAGANQVFKQVQAYYIPNGVYSETTSEVVSLG